MGKAGLVRKQNYRIIKKPNSPLKKSGANLALRLVFVIFCRLDM